MSNSKVTVKTNLKKTFNNLMGAMSATLEVSSELIADGTGLAVSAVRQIKPVGKELLQSPLSAHKGYLVEQGVSEDEAQARAFGVLDKSMSDAIKSGSEAAGAMVASLLEGWDEDETKEEEAKS